MATGVAVGGIAVLVAGRRVSVGTADSAVGVAGCVAFSEGGDVGLRGLGAPVGDVLAARGTAVATGSRSALGGAGPPSMVDRLKQGHNNKASPASVMTALPTHPCRLQRRSTTDETERCGLSRRDIVLPSRIGYAPCQRMSATG